MMGLLRKRRYVFLKKLKIQGIQWLIALGILLLAVIVSHASSRRTIDSGDEERLQIDLSMYGNTDVFYGGGVSNLEDAYGNLVKYEGSVSIKSLKDVNSGNNNNDLRCFYLFNVKTFFFAAIIGASLKDFMYYRKKLIVAAEFNATDEEPLVNVMYSNFALHGLPISLNLIMNSVLKTYVGDEFSIESANSPLSGLASSKIPRTWDLEVGISWLMTVPVGKCCKLNQGSSNCFGLYISL